MMNSSIYTRRKMGLDRNVWAVLLVVCVLCLGLLGYKLSDNEPACGLVNISVTGAGNKPKGSYYLGETIHFTAIMPGAKQISWDFGDNTPHANGTTVTHSFLKEGNFKVTATVNGRCMEMASVMIQKLVQQVRDTSNTSAITSNPIIGVDAPEVGEQVNYLCTIQAASYEWTILNAPNFPTQRAFTATYNFSTPGARVIQLKLDNDPKKVYTMNVQVLPSTKVEAQQPNPNLNVPAPVVVNPVIEPQPQNNPVDEKKTDPVPEVAADKKPTKLIYISDDLFKSMLMEVVAGKKDAHAFDQYLCSGGNTKVMENGDWTVFTALCQRIKGQKKIKIESVHAARDEKNCVVTLKVEYKKKGFLGL